MTLAIKRLHGLGWTALVFIVLILLYPLSLQVASVRSDLITVNREIVVAKREISYLEADLGARANYGQLVLWNDLQFGYAAPSAKQYLEGERALAELVGNPGKQRPVLVSVSGSLGGVAPAGMIGGKIPTFDDVRSTARAIAGGGPDKNADRPVIDTPADPGASAQRNRAEPQDDGVRAGVRLAQMESKLISTESMRDLRRIASNEAARP